MFNVKKLRLLLAERKMNVKQLAAVSGVSAVAIGNILNHGGKAKFETIGKLADGLKIPVSELMTDD